MMTAKRLTNTDARDGITINIRSVSSFLNVSIDELRTKEDYLPEHPCIQQILPKQYHTQPKIPFSIAALRMHSSGLIIVGECRSAFYRVSLTLRSAVRLVPSASILYAVLWVV